MKEGNEKFHLNINTIKMVVVVVVAAVQKVTLTIYNDQILIVFFSYNTEFSFYNCVKNSRKEI